MNYLNQFSVAYSILVAYIANIVQTLKLNSKIYYPNYLSNTRIKFPSFGFNEILK